MPYLRIGEARAAGRVVARMVNKTAGRVLTEDARSFSDTDHYDVFLSHSFQDSEVILGIRNMMKLMGMSVYVDWIDDPQLDRSRVTRNSADTLRQRMKVCSSLVYVHTAGSAESSWMPWELGYFDGMRPHFIWILPLVEVDDREYKGQEYLSLYPAVEKLSDLPGRLLGITNVGHLSKSVPLNEAARGSGIWFS